MAQGFGFLGSGGTGSRFRVARNQTVSTLNPKREDSYDDDDDDDDPPTRSS